MANMLGPHPPPVSTEKVANIPILQPPPSNSRPPRSTSQIEAASRNSLRLHASPPLSAAQASRSERSPNSSLLSAPAPSASRSPDKNKTAHVRPFVQNSGTGPSAGMGDVRGASANWRPLTGADGRVDLLAGQRQQLKQYDAEPRSSSSSSRLNDSFGSNHSGGGGGNITHTRGEGTSGARYWLSIVRSFC